MDRLEAMSMLLLTVDKGSLSAAGRELRVPLPTLSRKISELEAVLGTRLLVRTTRKLSLTDAGIAYVAAARRILEQVDDAERMAAGEYMTPKGELVLTAPIVFGRLHVLPVITEFLATFPEINVRLVLSDRNAHLVDDHVDMALRIGPLPDSSMVATRIGTMRTVICASPALLAGHGTPMSPQDFSRLPCVSFDLLTPASDWRFPAPETKGVSTVRVNVRLSVTTAEAAVDAAIAGIGATRVLHYQAADAIARGDLRTILEAYEPEPLPINLIHASHGRMPLKMRSFLDFAASRLRAKMLGH
jgi:DNA-binding transcriptional LysR family regulator